MKINLEQYVYNIDGDVSSMKKPKRVVNDDLSTEEGEYEKVFFTIGRGFESCLLAKDTFDYDKEKSEADVMQRYELFKKIHSQKEVELTKEEVDFIKKLIVIKFDTYFAGEILEYLNNLK